MKKLPVSIPEPNDLHDEDTPRGRLLSRKEALAILGASGASLLLGSPRRAMAAANTCMVRPEMTEGPFYVEENLNRSDIRTDPSDGAMSAGIPLVLGFQVSRLVPGGCEPLPGAVVDVWHCDAQGVYSDVQDAKGKRFLRGYQVTDAEGLAQFTTIYPGWYPGRAVHIHFKVRSQADADRVHEFTSQLFFDDVLNDEVYAKAPYAARGAGHMRNADDGIYRRAGKETVLDVKQAGEGYAGVFELALDMPGS